MKKQISLVLFILFFFVNYVFASNISNIENKNFNIHAFDDDDDDDDDDDCPEDVKNDIDDPTSLIICAGETVSFTGTVKPTSQSTIKWQYNSGSGWTDIDGANSKNYTTDALTVTTSFRRIVNYKKCATDYISDPKVITVIAVLSPPTIDVSDECGQSVLTATGYKDGATLEWSNGQSGESITVTQTGTFTVTQTVNGCTSKESDPKTTNPKTTPILSASGIDAATCGGLGSINFTFTNVPNGTYTISFDGGVFSGVSVSGGTASVNANAGNYNNLTINVNGCTSVEGKNITLENPDPPATPTGDQNQSFCSSENPNVSDLVVNGADIKWYSNGAGTNSISVSTALIDGTIYYATQTIGGCESSTLAVTAEISKTPTISASKNNPLICGGLGSLNFAFTNVPNGIYTITYDAGSFPLVTVLNNSATVLTSSGTYNNLKITVNGCTSVNGVNIALVDPNAPNVPTIIVENLCGESVLTAGNYEEGATLNWSTGETGQSITVTEAKTYSLTQKINGCISDAATAMANPKKIPSAPDFSVTDNCNGTSTLTSTDYESGATLRWSTGETAVTITVNSAGNYSLTQTVDGCESKSTTKTAAPKSATAMQIFKSEPEVCGGLGKLGFTFTGVPNGIYTIYYDGGSFENVIVSGNIATVSAYAGSYNNLTISVNNCNSTPGINITLTEPNAPVIPNVIIDNRCGESVLTVTSYDVNASLKWNTGETTQTITVELEGTYSVVQTLNGCTSAPRTVNAAPRTLPDAPDFLITNNCDGTLILTATNFNINATLKWSTGEIEESIIVTEPGVYSLSQILNGCESDIVTKEVETKTVPTIVATAIAPESCGENGSINFTFTGVPDGMYDIFYDNGSFLGIEVSDNKTSVETTVGTYNNLTITVNECTSAEGINATLSEPNAPETPTIDVANGCNESILTVTNYDESATLIWNTGDTGTILTVTEAGTYSVTQELNGCTSDAASVAVTPILTAETPDVELIDECGESVIFIKNLPDDTWFIWEFNNTIDSTLDNSIILTQPGEYTVYQSAAECTSEDTTLTVNPKETPEPPVSGGDKLICVVDTISKLTAEVTLTDNNAIIVWFDAETGGNVVLSPELDLPGTITYFAESQHMATGCKSPFRVPVTLSILESAKTLIADTTIIGKPQTNVAVIIFPVNLTSYQWYMNKTELPGETEQYYYIPEPDRKNENIFSVQVEIPSGCKALFSYTYSDILRSALLGGTSDLQNFNIPSFNIYPNPTSQEFYISLDASIFIFEPILNAKIFSVNGVCVSDFKISSPIERIDSRKFSPGIYSVVLYGKQGTQYTKRLVITH